MLHMYAFVVSLFQPVAPAVQPVHQLLISLWIIGFGVLLQLVFKPIEKGHVRLPKCPLPVNK